MTYLHLLIFLLLVAQFVIADEEEQTWPPDILPKHCSEVLRPWENWESAEGIYKIDVQKSGLGSFDVYCARDPEGGPAWTVILRRMDGSENFNRKRNEYENGFGNLNGEFFIGLKKLHALTNSTENELWVELKDFQNESRYAKYRQFSISGEDTGYTLHVANYTGNAGDTLDKDSNGRKFVYADVIIQICPSYYRSSWWLYDSCYERKLTGEYKQYKDRKTYKGYTGIIWKTFHKLESLQYAQMAIRPNRYS